jgi:hypothetical protein
VQNIHTTPSPSRHALHARGSSIGLTLSTQFTNVGGNINDDLYRDVCQALENACPHPQDTSCEKKKGKFGVWVPKRDNQGNYTRKEDLNVTVVSAHWNGDQKMYDLLIKTVAGVAGRGTWLQDNCYKFPTKWHGPTYTFCNTFRRIAVSFPGNNYINVTLDSSSSMGSFDCWKIGETAAAQVQNLTRIAELVGEPDLYVDYQCKDV